MDGEVQSATPFEKLPSQLAKSHEVDAGAQDMVGLVEVAGAGADNGLVGIGGRLVSVCEVTSSGGFVAGGTWSQFDRV